jgi:hypothetical protein
VSDIEALPPPSADSAAEAEAPTAWLRKVIVALHQVHADAEMPPLRQAVLSIDAHRFTFIQLVVVRHQSSDSNLWPPVGLQSRRFGR